MLVRVVDLDAGLHELHARVVLVLEAQRAVAELAAATAEHLVQRAGVDDGVDVLAFGADLSLVERHLGLDPEVRVIRHVAVQGRLAPLRHHLVFLVQVAFVPVEPQRNTRRHRRRQLARRDPPLLRGVVPEQQLVEFATDVGKTLLRGERESLTPVMSDSPLLLARPCYHRPPRVSRNILGTVR